MAPDLFTDTGDQFLRVLVWAVRSSPARTGKHSETGELLGRIQVTFRIEFDWAFLSKGQRWQSAFAVTRSFSKIRPGG